MPLITSLEQESLAFISYLQELYCNRKNLSLLLSMLDEDIEYIGTGRQEVYHGLDQLTAYLIRENESIQEPFSIHEVQSNASSIGSDLCMVTGHVVLRRQGTRDNGESQENALLSDMLIRFSALCRKTLQGIRLRQIHISTPSITQRDEEFMPSFLLERNPEFLQQLVEQQAKELQEKNRDLHALANNIPGGVICCDASPALKLLQFSDGFCSMFGYTRKEITTLFNNAFIEMVYPEDREIVLSLSQLQTNATASTDLEYRVYSKNGTLIWVRQRCQLVYQEGNIPVYYCILIDITQDKRDREALRLSLERHQLILGQTSDIIFEWNIPENTLAVSPAWEGKFGFNPLLHLTPEQLQKRGKIHPDDLDAFCKLMASMRNGTSYCETEFRILIRKGQYRWFRCRATLQLDDKNCPAKAIGVIIDIHEDKLKTQALQEKAQRDPFTELYNKSAAHDLMEKMLAENPQQKHALIIIDIDNFKQINDVFGHPVGDAIIIGFAAALRNLFREEDIIGRIGGDEFSVMMRNVENLAVITERIDRLLTAMGNLMMGHSQNISHLSCSIGIAMFPQDGDTFATLFRNADIALYSIKKRDKNNYCFFSPDLLLDDNNPVSSMI